MELFCGLYFIKICAYPKSKLTYPSLFFFMKNIFKNHAKKFSWLQPILRIKRNMDQDYVGLIAAGVAFYFFLAAFPALAALISLYGLFSDPSFISQHINLLARFLPAQTVDVFVIQAHNIASSSGNILSFSLFISIILTTYSATKGVNALIQGFNIAYNQREKRHFVTVNLIALALTLLIVIYFMASLTLIAGVPALIQLIPFPPMIAYGILWLRWPALFASALIGLEVLYYFGPSRTTGWRWISWGAIIAAILWLLFSSLFSLFVANFAQYNKIYGSLGAVVVLLLWFWLSALMILVGA